MLRIVTILEAITRIGFSDRVWRDQLRGHPEGSTGPEGCPSEVDLDTQGQENPISTSTDKSTLYIGYTAIGYSAKWVLGCPDLPVGYLIGYNAKNWLQCGVKSVITRI